jgi:hypothetical protein
MKSLILVAALSIAGCCMHTHQDTVVCPKVQKSYADGDELYCAIPYVEMQANYHNLDTKLISVVGVLSLMAGEALLVDPSTEDYDLPQHYNVVALEVAEDDYEKLKPLHGKYVAAYGKFNARYTGSGEGVNMIAHSISDVTVYEALP